VVVRINDDLRINDDELRFEFARSSGPGGQNVNRIQTKVEVRFRLGEAEWLPVRVRSRLAELYPRRLTRSGDFVVVSSRYRTQARNLEDCIAKGVKVFHMYTSGFSEIGIDDMGKLQDELVEIARKGGIRIMGPNCMGIYYPASGISFCPTFPTDSGSVGLIAQSGSYSLLVTIGAASRGVRFSKMVSYGNASDIDECDLLEYLAENSWR